MDLSMLRVTLSPAARSADVWEPHVADLHVAPDPLARQGVALHRHVAGLHQGQLQHEAAAVVGDAPHHVQAPGRPRHIHWVLRQAA